MGNHKIKTMTTRGLQLGAVSLLSAAISACGGGNGTTGGETPSSSSSSVVSSVSSSVASSSSSSVVSSVSSSSSSSVSSSSVPSSSSSSSVAPSSSSSSSSSSSVASGGDIASGAALFVEQCTLCHSDLGNGTYSFIDPNNLVKIVAPYSLSVEGLAQYITEQMPKDVPSLGFHPDQCVDQCATDTAAFIWSLRDDSGEGTSSSASSSSVASSSSSSSSSSSVASGEDFVVLYAVNAGGRSFTAADGTPFSADRFFMMGSTGSTADAIADTEDDVLYQSERWGLFNYNFPVEAGTYDVTLHLVEAWHGENPGNRVFNVEVEGEVLVEGFDPLAAAGHDVANVIELTNVEVTDGELSMEFVASMGEASVSAIVVKGVAGNNTEEPGDPVEPEAPQEPTAERSCEAGSDLMICLDFEDVAAGGTPDGFTKVGSASGFGVVEGEEAYSGNRSLKISSVGGYAFLQKANVSGNHWGRLYYKMKTPVPSTGGYMHATFVTTTSGQAPEFRVVDAVQGPTGTHQYIYNVEPGDVSLQGDYAYTFDDQWICAEWQLNAADQTWRFFRNGQELSFTNGGTVTNSTNLPGFAPVPATLQALSFGLRVYQGNGIEGWMDDIAVGAERIGCDVGGAG